MSFQLISSHGGEATLLATVLGLVFTQLLCWSLPKMFTLHMLIEASKVVVLLARKL